MSVALMEHGEQYLMIVDGQEEWRPLAEAREVHTNLAAEIGGVVLGIGVGSARDIRPDELEAITGIASTIQTR